MVALGIALLVALTLALIVAFVANYHSVFVVWMLWSGVQVWQAWSQMLADPQDLQWWMWTWAPVEMGSMVLAAGATAEALWLRTRSLPEPQRFWLRFGVAVMPASLVVYGAHWPHDTWYREFLAIREWVWAWLALTMVSGWLFFFWRSASCPRVIRWHAAVLAVLMIAHAAIAPQLHSSRVQWFRWQAGYRLVAIGCFAAWIVNAVRLFGQTAYVPAARVPATDRAASRLSATQCDQSLLLRGFGEPPIHPAEQE